MFGSKERVLKAIRWNCLWGIPEASALHLEPGCSSWLCGTLPPNALVLGLAPQRIRGLGNMQHICLGPLGNLKFRVFWSNSVDLPITEDGAGCAGVFPLSLQWLSHERRLSSFKMERCSSRQEWWHTPEILAARRLRQRIKSRRPVWITW